MKTKLQLLLFLLLLCSSTAVNAQQPDSTKTYLDFIVNPVGTNLNYGNDNAQVRNYKKSAFGGQLGISFQAGISPYFSIVTELYFSMKGGKLKAGNPLTTGKSMIRSYGFELPILPRIHFSGFHVNAEPSIAYNFKTTHQLADVASNLAYKDFEAGLQMGGGYTFKIKKRRVMLDLRYNYGLTNISKQNEIYNRNFIVNLYLSKAWKANPFAR